MPRLSVPIDRDCIRTMIPHAGKMCLLDAVLAYDEAGIECRAVSHLDVDNPLRHNGTLPIHTGIEYCGQAIALHGRLLAQPADDAAPRRGYLAVILNAEWTTDRLDTCVGELQVIATKQVALQQGVSYAFALKHQGHTLLAGQAVVALESPIE